MPPTLLRLPRLPFPPLLLRQNQSKSSQSRHLGALFLRSMSSTVTGGISGGESGARDLTIESTVTMKSGFEIPVLGFGVSFSFLFFFVFDSSAFSFRFFLVSFFRFRFFGISVIQGGRGVFFFSTLFVFVLDYAWIVFLCVCLCGNTLSRFDACSLNPCV